MLVLQALRERTGIAGTERDHSSGRIRSKPRGDWTYGRWAASGEIDIIEFKAQEVDTLLGTLHFGGSWPRNTSQGDLKKFSGVAFSAEFHNFAIE